MTENNNFPVVVETSTEQIQNLIYVIRGKQVMIDSDLAMLLKARDSGAYLCLAVHPAAYKPVVQYKVVNIPSLKVTVKQDI